MLWHDHRIQSDRSSSSRSSWCTDSRRLAEVVACILSIAMTILFMHLISRHRQAEHANWIEERMLPSSNGQRTAGLGRTFGAQ
jgi:hypothetical protein